MEDWVTIRNLKKHNPKLVTRSIANIFYSERVNLKTLTKKLI